MPSAKSDELPLDPAAFGLIQVGRIYEVRPPGVVFARPVALSMIYSDDDLKALRTTEVTESTEKGGASVPLAEPAICPGEIALHSTAPNPKSQIENPKSNVASSRAHPLTGSPAHIRPVEPSTIGHKPSTILPLIYEYAPVEQLWRALPCKVDAEKKTVSAEITSVPRYVAFYALLADTTPPQPPRLTVRVTPTTHHSLLTTHQPLLVCRQSVSIEGQAEPGCRVELSVVPGTEHRQVRLRRTLQSAQADIAGRFAFDQVQLSEGVNQVAAVAIDDAGNRSEPCTRLRVELKRGGPTKVASLEILGPRQAVRDDRLLVCLKGQDSDANATNSVAVRVASSLTDPKGFDLELVETGPATGTYVGMLRVGETTNGRMGELAALKQGEAIAATAANGNRASLTYGDRVPPSAPIIHSPTHPIRWQDTFETGMGEWTGRDGPYGAQMSAERDGDNAFLSVRAPAEQQQSSLGATVRSTPFSLKDAPFVAFDYRVTKGVMIDLFARFQSPAWGWKAVNLTHRMPFYPQIGRAFGASPDGQWRHAEFNLLGMVRRGHPGIADSAVAELAFMNIHLTGFSGREYGRVATRGEAYAIDNFRVFKPSDKPDVTFVFGATDENGIAGFSYVLDHEPNTVPDEQLDDVEAYVAAPEKGLNIQHSTSNVQRRTDEAQPPSTSVSPPAPQSQIANPKSKIEDAIDHEPSTITHPPRWASKTYKGLDDGRWYFHVRGQDKAGNWGRANHYMVVIDREPPVVRFLAAENAKSTEARGSGLGPRVSGTGSPNPETPHPKPLPWYNPVRIETRDTCGVDPYSVLLEVDGQTYDADNRGFDFDPATGLITFSPVRASPRPVLFADGQKVRVRLLKATDHLGRPYVLEESRASVPLAKAATGTVALHSASQPPKSGTVLETEYVVSSPLKLTPANPDGKNGWYVTMPTFALATESTETAEAEGSRMGPRTESPKPTPSAESAKSAVPSPSPVTRHPSPAAPPTLSVDWLRTTKGDPHAERGNAVNTLLVRGKLPKQAMPVYGKRVKVDTTVPKTTAKVERESVGALERESAEKGRASVPLAGPAIRPGEIALPSGAPNPQPITQNPKPVVVTLAHDDYVLEPGGLAGTYFKKPDFTEPVRERQDGPINFTTTDFPATPSVSGANSARWSGFLYVDKSQEYDLEIVVSQAQPVAASLYVNEELVVGPKEKGAPWSLKKKVLLTQGYHKLRVDVTFEKPVPWWLQLYWWRPDREWRELIPAEQLLAERSVAKTFYRWDDGKPQAYKGPIHAPAGKHLLRFWSEDEAGHVETEQKLEIEG
ncbi:MAG: hypothetical protein FJ279_12965 [Planctomycetes bacterium]|nr:hypothetical protein [Planctomycetota bacterium]